MVSGGVVVVESGRISEQGFIVFESFDVIVEVYCYCILEVRDCCPNVPIIIIVHDHQMDYAQVVNLDTD
jgi:hypothetical protein